MERSVKGVGRRKRCEDDEVNGEGGGDGGWRIRETRD